MAGSALHSLLIRKRRNEQRKVDGMDRKLLKELVKETRLEDISENYRPVVEIVGLEAFIELSEHAQGDEIYIPKAESIVAPARNRRIRKEYDGYNIRDLADKYDLTTKQIANILKDAPYPGQMSIFDSCEG